MGRKIYQERIEKWLALRDSGKSIREAFESLGGPACVHWLILPGEEKNMDVSESAADQWNELLFLVFARTPRYRQEDEALWRRLLSLAGHFQKEKNPLKESYRLLSRAVPTTGLDFIGRKRELSQIRAMLLSQGYAFLYGIGGIGKSAAAQAYALTYAAQYETVVYAPCENNLRRLFSDDERIPVENMAYIPSGKRGELGWYARRKLKILEQITDARTLLIIDNLDVVEDDFIELVLALPCHLLFTTRTDPAIFGHTGIQISALEKQADLLRLFALHYGPIPKEDEEDVKKLIDRFHGHTLHIQLAARRCALERIRPKEAAVFSQSVFDLPKLPQKERQALKNAALLPTAGMKLDWFLRLSGNIAASHIEMLRKRGLMEYHANQEQIALHPLIRREVLETLNPGWAGVHAFTSRFAEELSGFWNMPIKQKTGFSSYILQILDTLPLTDVRNMDTVFTLADLLWQLGQWDYALNYTQKLYYFCKDAFGCPHPHTARAAHLAASVYHNQRESQKASPWFEKAWLAYRDWPRKELALEALYQMKRNRYFAVKGDFAQAEECLLRAEKLYLSGITSKAKLKSLGGFLTNAYIEHTRLCMRQEKYTKALLWCEKAQKLSQLLSGGGTTRAFIYHDAAILWKHLNDAKKARAYIEKAKKLAEQFLVEGSLERTEIEKEWKKQKMS